MLTWEGWTFIGTVAQVLSLVTLVVGAWRFTRQRRQFPLVLLDWHVIGNTTLASGETYHVVEFRNIGRGTAHLRMMHFTEARVELTAEYRAPHVLPSGERFQLLVTAHKLEAVWFRTLLQTPNDTRRMVWTWFPLMRTGELWEQSEREWDQWQARPLLQKLRDYWNGVPVYPGSAPRGTIGRAQSKKAARRVIDLPSTGGLWHTAMADGREVADIPRVR